MANLDESTKISPVSAVDADTISTNTTTVGNIIDTQGFQSIEFLFTFIDLASGTFTPLLEESDSSTFTTSNVIDVDFLLGAIAGVTFVFGVDGNTAKRIGSVAKKRFIRFSIVSTGVTGDNALVCCAVLGNANTQPVDPS